MPPRDRFKPLPFLAASDIHFSVVTEEQAGALTFDVVFASWWETLVPLSRLRARTYAIFSQALEAQFYAPGAWEQKWVERMVQSEIPVITIANWLRHHFVTHFGVPEERVCTVLNPLDPALWRPTAPTYPKNDGAVRFLLEGPSSDPRKNVKPTIELLERATPNTFGWAR